MRALLLAAISAPSAGNIQPWRFTVCVLPRRASGLQGRSDSGGRPPHPSSSSSRSIPRPCAARYGDRGEMLYSIQDTAAAVSNILLAAVDRGLASCWIGAFDETAVREALGIPAPITPIAILPVGHSAESSAKPARDPSRRSRRGCEAMDTLSELARAHR
jgi:nitroreductase